MRIPTTIWAATWAPIVARLSMAAVPDCPFPGPAFPKPTKLASSETFKSVLAGLTSTFEARDQDPTNNPNGTSWSIQVFSVSDGDDGPLWEHHHSAPSLENANTGGVKEVNGDTIYRLGSLTKVFTILTFLIEAGDGYWNTAVTKFVPELALLADKYQYDPVMNVDWASITLGELASHTAGIVRDYALLGELTQENNQTVLESQGFPPAPVNETPICGEWITCNRVQFFNGLGNVPPSFGTAWTVGYSNVGYQILAYALEAITGKKFANMLQSDVIDKLGLKHTYYQKPPDNLGIIVQGQQSGWNYSLGDASPTGNMYSSTNDLSALGRAILGSRLISGGQTRRWLKPAILTSDLHEGVSYPWGVKRIPLSTGEGGGSSRITDAYNKAGSINTYSSLIIILPDYDVGISALLAGGWPGNANWAMADAIGKTLVPALEEAARMEADAMFSGTYSSNTSSTDNSASLNSTIVLSTEEGRPGLGIDRWVSNGTDMVPVAIRYTLNYNVTVPALRLYPTGLETRHDDGSRKMAFKAMIQDRGATDHATDMFSTNCGTWVGQTTAVYASMPLDQFVFHLDASGEVKSIESLALRAVLDKE
ncbi:beta-lactamase/transpeptidase-like protein [Apiospora kogelbergensis]|uniref:Beta-lactamase/transpeptidase-like protein n=1 Tax=Apiospora kogelbergensis TaxID=1337665 RepID=A0AAW0QE71_9PEZI